MSAGSITRYWLPPILWTAVIFAASSDLFSAGHTGTWLAAAIRTIGHPPPPSQFAALHVAIRKAAHLIEYGILGILLFRALRADRQTAWKLRWSVAAIVIAAAVGSLDEWHQLFVRTREASAWDVLIDATGAALSQVLFFRK